MADPKKFNKGKIRVRESVNDGPRNLPSVNETTIIGGIESYLESIGSDLARGILSLVIGDTSKRSIGELSSVGITQSETIYAIVNNISAATTEIKNDVKQISENIQKLTSGLISDNTKNILDLLYTALTSPDNSSKANSLSITVDTKNAKNLKSIFESLSNLSDKENKYVSGLNSLELIFEEINKIFNQSGPGYMALNNFNAFVEKYKESLKDTSLIEFFNNLKALAVISKLDISTLKEMSPFLDTIFSDLHDTLEAISQVDFKEYVDKIKIQLEYIRSLYEEDIHLTAVAVKNSDKDLDLVKEGINNSNEIATSTKNIDEKDIEISLTNAGNLIRAIAAMGVVVLIGGYMFNKNQHLMTASVQFGAILGVFLLELAIPIAIIAGIASLVEGCEETLDDIITFVGISSAILTIAGLFFMIPKLPIGAMSFALLLKHFLMQLLIPLALVGLAANLMDYSALGSISLFITTATFMMTIGASIMMIGNGIVYKKAIEFGLKLGVFIATVIWPFIIYEKMVKHATGIARNVNAFVITCTAIMLIGAAIVRNKPLMHYALSFGTHLGLFIGCILLPLLLLKRDIVEGSTQLQQLSLLVVTAASVMLIGAYFVSRRNTVRNSLIFGLVLGTFISLVIAPIAIFAVLSILMFRHLRQLITFVTLAASLMFIGAFIVLKYPQMITASLAFGIIMGLFITAITAPFILFSKPIQIAARTIIAFTLLVGTIGLLMYLTIRTVDKYGSKALLALVGIAFLFGATWGLMKLFTSRLFQKDLAKGFATAIYLAGFIAVLGGLLWLITKAAPKDWKSFLIVLSSITMMGAVFTGIAFLIKFLASIKLTKAQVKNASELILVCAGTLILMAATIFIINKAIGNDWAAMGVALISITVLAAVTAGMVFLMIKLAKSIKADDLLRIKEVEGIMLTCVGALLILAGAVYILGQLDREQLIQGVLAIAALGAIVSILSLVIKLIASLEIGDTKAANLTLLAVAGTLLILSYTLKILASIGTPQEVWKYVGILGALAAGVVVMNLLMVLISKIPKKDVITGIFIAGSMSIVLILLSGAVAIIAKSGVEMKHVGILGVMALIVTGMIAIAGLLGAAVPLIPLITIGEVLIAGIAGIMLMLGGAVLETAKAVNLIKGVDKPGEIIGTFIKDILTSVSSPEIIALRLLSGRQIKKIMKIIRTIGKNVGDTAMLVADLAVLKVPISWDSNGRANGYRLLNASDFDRASKGIGIIITTLLNAVTDKELIRVFDSRGKLKDAKRVLNASKELGEVIGNIADGLKAYVNLQIPIKWNDNGKAIGFQKLTDSDFVKAAKNIKTVITTLITPIIELTKDKEFMKTLKGHNPDFNKVLDSFKDLGTMISKVATGIGNYASMTIPIYQDGKEVGKELLTDAKRTAAANNIQTILITLAKAVVDTYSKGVINGENVFDYDIKKKSAENRSSKLLRVIEASKNIGDMLTSIAKGIVDMANLRFVETYDKDGNPLTYRTLKAADFTNAGNSIARILTVTIKAINDIDWEKNNIDDVKQRIEAIIPIGNLISEIGAGIKAMAELKVPVFNKEGKIIDYTDLRGLNFDTIGENIAKIITGVFNGIMTAYNTLNITDNNISKTELITALINAFNPLGDFIHKISDSIVSFATGTKDINDLRGIIDNLMVNASNIINSIFGTIIDIYNNDKNKKYFSLENPEQSLQNIVSQLNSVFKLVESTIKIVSSVKEHGMEVTDITKAQSVIEAILGSKATRVKGLIDTILDLNFTDSSISRLLTISDGLSTFNSIINDFANIVKDIYSNRESIQAILSIKASINENTADTEGYIGIFKDIKVILNNISKLSSISIDKLNQNNISTSLSIFTEVIQSIANSTDDLLNIKMLVEQGIFNRLDNSNTIFDELIKFIVSGLKNLNKLNIRVESKRVDNNLSNFDTYLVKLVQIASNITEADILSKLFNSTYKANITAYIDNIHSIMLSIKGTMLDEKLDNRSLNTIITKINLLRDIFTQLTTLSFYELYKKSEEENIIDQETGKSSLEILVECISNLNEELRNTDKDVITKLSNETNTLDKFVKAVNKIDLRKVDALHNLMESIALLAEKIGGFDKLVDAIDGDFKNVLDELAEKIEAANSTIREAKKFEEEKKKDLEDNMKDLKALMGKAITVNVGKLDDEGNVVATEEIRSNKNK